MAYPNQPYYGNPIVGGGPSAYNYPSNYYSPPVSNANQMMQSQTTNQQTPSLLGRMVGTETDIVPNEVPMDGNVGFFVQNDLKRIYAKSWGRDGNIYTNVYELVTPGTPETTETQNGFDLILERLDKIEQSLKRSQNKSYHKNNYKPKSQKEGMNHGND